MEQDRRLSLQLELLKKDKSRLLSQLTAQESVIDGLRAERKIWGQELAQQGRGRRELILYRPGFTIRGADGPGPVKSHFGTVQLNSLSHPKKIATSTKHVPMTTRACHCHLSWFKSFMSCQCHVKSLVLYSNADNCNFD